MEVFIKRKSDNKILKVKKYIFAEKENQQHIWCSDWYGHHIIGSDCEWVEKGNNNYLQDEEIHDLKAIISTLEDKLLRMESRSKKDFPANGKLI